MVKRGIQETSSKKINLWLVIALGLIILLAGVYLISAPELNRAPITEIADDDGSSGGISDEYFLAVGQSVTVNKKIVTLLNVASGVSPSTVALTVDNLYGNLDGSNTKTINCLNMQLLETFYSDAIDKRSARIWIVPTTQPCQSMSDFNVIKTNFTDATPYADGKAFCQSKGYSKCVFVTKNFERIHYLSTSCTGIPQFKELNEVILDCSAFNPPTGGGACGVTSGSPYSVSEGYSNLNWKVVCEK